VKQKFCNKNRHVLERDIRWADLLEGITSPAVLPLSCLPDGIKKLLERGLCQHATKVRSIIAHKAYVFNDHVIYLPIARSHCKPLIDGIFLSFATARTGSSDSKNPNPLAAGNFMNSSARPR
jgi:hypothetical protein